MLLSQTQTLSVFSPFFSVHDNLIYTTHWIKTQTAVLHLMVAFQLPDRQGSECEAGPLRTGSPSTVMRGLCPSPRPDSRGGSVLGRSDWLPPLTSQCSFVEISSEPFSLLQLKSVVRCKERCFLYLRRKEKLLGCH